MFTKVLGYIFYIMAGLLLIFLSGLIILSNTYLSFKLPLLLGIFICLFIYLGGLFLSKYLNNKKPMQINLKIYFIFYLVLLIYYTLLASLYGRGGFRIVNIFNMNYLKYNVNLVPFKTIKQFIRGFNSLLNAETVFLNLFGNFLILMPMAFFLRLLFKKQNKFKIFFPTIFLMVLAIEFTQLLTASGRFDIDDFLLNILGAILVYGILKIDCVNKLIRNIFLLEKNHISKKKIIIIIGSFITIIGLLVSIFIYEDKLSKYNNDEFNRIHNPILTIFDKNKDCEEGKDLFYEDEFYKYYFPCAKQSANFYIEVMDDKTYLLEDFLNNKTYNYGINRLLDYFDANKIDYLKENKYESINLKVKIPNKDGSFTTPEKKVVVSNPEVIEAKFDSNNQRLEESNFEIILELIPKQKGDTKLTVIFIDVDNKKTIYKYKVTVDENLEVKYIDENNSD